MTGELCGIVALLHEGSAIAGAILSEVMQEQSTGQVPVTSNALIMLVVEKAFLYGPSIDFMKSS